MINDVIKSLTTFFLVFSLVFSSFFSLPTKKAEAFLGDSVSGTALLAKRIADGIAMAAAQAVIDRMVQSSIDWAQNGFEGNPAYVTDPKQYFSDIGDGVAGEFIAGSDLNFLCSPFQTQVRLALLKTYNEPPQFQCTLTEVVGNIEAFYDDFSQGGWDAWFSMTQNDNNNPYGAFLVAQAELDSRLAEKLGLASQELEWNQGFLSWAPCLEHEFAGFNQNGTPIKGKCVQRDYTKTPGATIKGQLDKVLPSGLEKMVNANHLEQIIAAFASGLLNRYVFGSKGLFNPEKNPDAPPPTPPPPTAREIDIDGDGIVDGVDANGDGQPDLCYFGGLTQGTSGPPCKGSRDAGGGGDGGEGQGIDIDGDGISDGFDSDSDGNINTCYFGGTPPDNCKGSRENGGGGTATSLIEDLRAERAKYPQASLITLCPNGSGLQPDTCPLGAMLNAVAWKNRDKGWGLSGKAGGHRCKSPAGIIACDILQFKPTLVMYDVFGRSGEETTPRWGELGPPSDPVKRPWVAPAAP